LSEILDPTDKDHMSDMFHSFLKSQLGAPTVTDYEQLAQEKDKLELELSEAKSQIEQLESKVLHPYFITLAILDLLLPVGSFAKHKRGTS